MINPCVFPSYRSFSLIVICALLGACSTMQKSSTGSGEQAAAPISEAAKPDASAKPGETPNSLASGAAGAPAIPNSNSTRSADTAGATTGRAGVRPNSSESGAASSTDDEVALLKRQLAEQDAQISKLRNDQQHGAGREEAGAATQHEQQSATAATQEPASPGVASPTASRGQDEMAVFPASANAEDSPGRDSVVPRTLERSVYFDYNQSSVHEMYDSMLMANAAYLKG
jgi:hypothetical protein